MKAEARTLSLRTQIKQFASMAAWITAIVVVTIVWRSGNFMQEREMASVPAPQAAAAASPDNIP